MAKKSLRRQGVDGGLTITSMMDMMTIILVFLLKSYSTEDISVAPSDDLQIPVSSALTPPRLAVNVVVSRKEILVDSVPVLRLEQVSDPKTGETTVAIPDTEKKGQMVSRLYDRLLDKAETAKTQGTQANSDDLEFKGQILLQCDRRLPFSVVREVMYTAGCGRHLEKRAPRSGVPFLLGALESLQTATFDERRSMAAHLVTRRTFGLSCGGHGSAIEALWGYPDCRMHFDFLPPRSIRLGEYVNRSDR